MKNNLIGWIHTSKLYTIYSQLIPTISELNVHLIPFLFLIGPKIKIIVLDHGNHLGQNGRMNNNTYRTIAFVYCNFYHYR